ANLVAGIIEKGRLQREAKRKLREVSALFEVSNILTSTLELDEVLSLLVARLVRVYPGSAGAVFLRDGDELRERARSGEPGKAMAQTARQALNEARPIVAGDRLALPLLAGERLLGAVALRVPAGTELADEEVAFVGALANQAALAIDKASQYALERQTTDRLRELERARDRRYGCARTVAASARCSRGSCTTRRSTRPSARGSPRASRRVQIGRSCVSPTKVRASRPTSGRASSSRTRAAITPRCRARGSVSSRR